MTHTADRHAARAVTGVILIVWLATVSQAQVPAGDAAPEHPTFLSQYNFHLVAAALAEADPRFSWDAHLGGDIDVVDFVRGRVNLLADYELLLGSQFQAFDPIQGNYTLEASVLTRVGGSEVGAVFHHVSRHLGDRPKEFGVGWNVVGARTQRRFANRATTVDLRAGAGWVIGRAYVDYQWTADVSMLARRQVRPATGVYVQASGELIGVDTERSDRPLQKGGRVEVGLRIEGHRAALDVFAGFERRIDAYLLERTAYDWPFAGFRLASR